MMTELKTSTAYEPDDGAWGPVMPETPSEDVLLSGLYAFWERQEHGVGDAFLKSEVADMGRAFSAIRAALLKEQGR